MSDTDSDSNGDTETNGVVCEGTTPDGPCETCLAENCCGAFTACEDDEVCLCTLDCEGPLCLLGCGVNVLDLVDYLTDLGLGNADDGCLIDECGVLCPVAGLL